MKKKVLKAIGEPASSWFAELGGEARRQGAYPNAHRSFGLPADHGSAHPRQDCNGVWGVACGGGTLEAIGIAALGRIRFDGVIVMGSPTRVIVPSPLAALLTQFAESFEGCRSEATKCEAFRHLVELAIVETTKTLAQPRRARAMCVRYPRKAKRPSKQAQPFLVFTKHMERLCKLLNCIEVLWRNSCWAARFAGTHCPVRIASHASD
jgi:hypothetical protein